MKLLYLKILAVGVETEGEKWVFKSLSAKRGGI